MLIRLRWFFLGALSSIGAIGWLVVKVKRARERLTAANLARSSVRSFADALDAIAERVAPSQD